MPLVTPIGLRGVLCTLFIAAGSVWSATALAQYVPTSPTTPGTTTGVPNSIHERLYPGVATGGIFTTGQQGRTSVQFGSATNGPAPPPASVVMQPPASGQGPGTLVMPRPGASGESQGPQGLYTAPSAQDPLGRFTP